jgi:hypothetical protein
MIVGPPMYGKTSIARALVRRHMAEWPTGIVLVHDPVAQFGGDGCYWYENADAWRAAAREAAKPESPGMPRGASLGGSTEDIVALAQELGTRAGNTQWNVRQPILVVLDEGSTNDNSGSTWIGKQDQQSLAMRRHRGNGFVFNVQTPMMLHTRFWEMATDFYIMVQTSRHAAVLDERLALEKGTLQRAGVCSLPPHRYLHARRVVGVVQEEL